MRLRTEFQSKHSRKKTDSLEVWASKHVTGEMGGGDVLKFLDFLNCCPVVGIPSGARWKGSAMPGAGSLKPPFWSHLTHKSKELDPVIQFLPNLITDILFQAVPFYVGS